MVLFLTRMIQRQSNHLRAILVRYYPAMLDIFSRLDSPTSFAFLEAYPIPQEAARLTYEQFTQFLRAHHHRAYPVTSEEAGGEIWWSGRLFIGLTFVPSRIKSGYRPPAHGQSVRSRRMKSCGVRYVQR